MLNASCWAKARRMSGSIFRLARRSRILSQTDGLLDHLQKALPAELALVSREDQAQVLDPFFQQVILQVFLAAQVLGFLFPFLHPVEGRLGDVQVPPLDERKHLPVEKGEEERPDVRTVHVGVGHDDDPVVAELVQVVVFIPHTRSQGRDEGLDLLVGDDLVEAGLFHVEDLAPQRQDGLASCGPFPVWPIRRRNRPRR